MRWYVQVYNPETRSWQRVGWIVDGVDSRILYACLTGLLLSFKGGQVQCTEVAAGREERYTLDSDGTLRKMQVVGGGPTC